MNDSFRNRADAGRQLAEALRPYAARSDVVVLALPRGGVPVAFEVANALHAPLDVLVVRKLGVPGNPELAMGAIASGGAIYLNDAVLRAARVADAQLAAVIERERAELTRREATYRGNWPALRIEGKTAIVVDDGLATGSSMFAALEAVHAAKPARVVIAVPVAPPDARRRFEHVADEFVSVLAPDLLFGVSQCYEDFTQTGDDEVRTLLDNARRQRPVPDASTDAPPTDERQ